MFSKSREGVSETGGDSFLLLFVFSTWRIQTFHAKIPLFVLYKNDPPAVAVTPRSSPHPHIPRPHFVRMRIFLEPFP